MYRAKGLTTEEIKLKVQKRINFLNEHEDLEQALHKQNPRIHISNDEIFAIQAARLAEVRIPASLNGTANNSKELQVVVLRGKGLDVEKIMALRVLMNYEFLLQYLKLAEEDKNGIFAAFGHLKLNRFQSPLVKLLEKLIAKAVELNYNGETLDSLVSILDAKERKILSRKVIGERSLLDIVKQCITDPLSIPLADIGMISEEQKAAETQRRISAVKAVMEPIIRKLEKNDSAGILDSYRCFYDDLTKEKIDISKEINEKKYQNKWSEAFILDMIDALGKTAAHLDDDSSIKHALIEVVRSLKDILWELLFSCDYATDLVREEVKKEVDKRFSELKKQIDNSLSALNENKESFKLASGKMAKGEELLDTFNAIIEEFLRNTRLNLEGIIQGQTRHLSYRRLLLEEAISDTLSQLGRLGTLEKMADFGYREFLKGQSEAYIRNYLSTEISRTLEATADCLIAKIEIDLHIEHKQEKDIALIADYLITSFEYDDLVRFFGGRLKCIISIFSGHCVYSAKAEGMPFFVLKNKSDIEHFKNGQKVVLRQREIVISPSPEMMEVFAAEVKEREALNEYYDILARQATERGEFPVSINGDTPQQLKDAPYASGIALVRTENMLKGIFFPGLRRKAVSYREILKASGGKAVKPRFYDDQYDKRPGSLSGLRYKGNKFYLEHPLGRALTSLDMKALLICREYDGFANFMAMAPMVEKAQEMVFIKDLLEKAKAELEIKGEVFELGAMAETPLAVENPEELINTGIIMFFSLGTNDYIRFLYGISRNDPKVYHEYFELVRPLVLKNIFDFVIRAQASGIKVFICGDLASIREFWPVKYYFESKGLDIMLSMPKTLTGEYKAQMTILERHKEEFEGVFNYLESLLCLPKEDIDQQTKGLNKILQAAAKKIEGFAKEAASDSARRLPGVTAQEAAAENIRINNQWDALKELDFALFESKIQKALKPFRWLFGNHRVDAFIDYIKTAGRIRAGPSDKIYGAFISGKGLFVNESFIHNPKELIKTIIHEFGAYLGLPHGVNTLLEFFFQPVRCPVYFSYILYASILELKDTINGFIRKPIKAVYLFFLGLMMVVQFSSIKFASVDFAAAWGFAPLAQAEEIKKSNFTLSSLSGAELSAAYSEVKEENKQAGEKAEPKEAPVAVQASSTKTDSGAAKEAVAVEEPKVEVKVELPKEEVAAKKEAVVTQVEDSCILTEAISTGGTKARVTGQGLELPAETPGYFGKFRKAFVSWKVSFEKKNLSDYNKDTKLIIKYTGNAEAKKMTVWLGSTTNKEGRGCFDLRLYHMDIDLLDKEGIIEIPIKELKYVVKGRFDILTSGSKMIPREILKAINYIEFYLANSPADTNEVGPIVISGISIVNVTVPEVAPAKEKTVPETKKAEQPKEQVNDAEKLATHQEKTALEQQAESKEVPAKSSKEAKEAAVVPSAVPSKVDAGAAKEAVAVEEPKVEAKVELPKEEVAAKKTEAPVMTTGPPAGNRGYVLGQPKAENSILKALEEGKTAYRKGNNAEAKEKLNTVINAEDKAIYGDEYKNEARGKRFAQDKKNAARRILGKIESQVSAPAVVAPQEEAPAAAQLVKTETIEAKAAEVEKTAPLAEAKVTEEAKPVETKKPEAPVAPVIQPAPAAVTPVDTEKIQELAKGREAIQEQLAEFQKQLTEEGSARVALSEELQSLQGLVFTSSLPLKEFYPVKVSGSQIMINGEPYFIRGTTWSPASKGSSSGSEFLKWYKKDISLMRAAGFNTVRTYRPVPGEVLDALAKEGIRVIIGFDWAKDIQTGNYIEYIQKYKNHPAILMWEFGNEYNLLFSRHPEWIEGGVEGWYRKLEKAVQRAHQEDSSHPVSTAHGEIPNKEIARKYDRIVDVLGVNIYRGKNITGVSKAWAKVSSKPIYIAETGVSSIGLNGQINQAETAEAIVAQVNADKDICGVTFMSFNDEWWKAKGSIGKQDNNAEEHWGFVDIDRNPKLVYAAAQKLWVEAKPVEITEKDKARIAELKEKLAQAQINITELEARIDDRQKRLAQIEKELSPAAAETVKEAQVIEEGGASEPKTRADEIKKDIQKAKEDIQNAKGSSSEPIFNINNELRDRVDRLFWDGKFEEIRKEIEPYVGVNLDLESKSWLEAVYIKTEASSLRAKGMQFRETRLEALKNLKGANKKDLLSLSLGFGNQISNTIFNLGEIGDINAGVVAGGEVSSVIESASIIKGFIDGSIEGGISPYLASLVLYKNVANEMQRKDKKLFEEDLGGLIIPLKETNNSPLRFELFGIGKVPGANLIGLELFNLFKAKLGDKTMLGVDVWAVDVEVGIDFKDRLKGILPKLTANASLFGDKVYIIQTRIGKFVYLPLVDADKQEIRGVKPADSYNLRLPGECLNEIVYNLFKGKLPTQYSAIRIPNYKTAKAYMNTVAGENAQDMWIEANLATGEERVYYNNQIISDSSKMGSRFYVRKEDKAKYGYETESYARQFGQWLWKTDAAEEKEPYKLVRVSGASDIARLETMLKGIVEYYGWQGKAGQDFSIIYNMEDLGISALASVPLEDDNTFSKNAEDKPVMTKRVVLVNPYTGEIIGGGFTPAFIHVKMQKGETGKQVMAVVDNGLVIGFIEEKIATEEIPEGTQFQYTYVYATQSNDSAKKTIKITTDKARKITYDENYTGRKNNFYTYKGRKFAFVNEVEVNAPQAIVSKYNNTSELLSKEKLEELKTNEEFLITVGNKREVTFPGYEPIVLGKEVNELWHTPKNAGGKSGPAELVGLIEYAKNMDDKDVYCYIDGAPVKVPPVGGITEEEEIINAKNIPVLADIQSKPEATNPEIIKVDSLAADITNYLGSLKELANAAKLFRDSGKTYQLLSGIYQDWAYLQEGVRIDLSNKMYMEEIIAWYEEWLANRLAWVNKNIALMQQGLAEAESAYNAEVIKVQGDITEIQQSLAEAQAERQQLISDRNYWAQVNYGTTTGNQGLVDYYNSLLASKATEITQLQQDLTNARVRLSGLQNNDQSINVVLGVINAQNGLNNWQERKGQLPSKEDWYKDANKANQSWSDAELKAAQELLSDAQVGVQYNQANLASAQNGVAYYGDIRDSAQAGLDTFNDELNVLDGSATQDGSIAWTQAQYNDALTSGTQADIDYWSVLLNNSSARRAELVNTFIPQAAQYLQSSTDVYNSAVVYQGEAQQALTEAQTYLTQVEDKLGATLGKTTEYLNSRTNTIGAGINTLNRFLPARDDMLDFAQGISRKDISFQKEKTVLYQKMRKVLQQSEKLSKAVRIPLLTERELKDLIESEDPQGYLGNFLEKNYLGNSAEVSNILQISGVKFDIYTVAMKRDAGSPETLQRGLGIRSPVGDNAYNVVALGIADRTLYEETGADEFEKWHERRFILGDNFVYSNGKWSFTYLGYADVSLDEDNNVYSHDVHLRDDLARGYFVELSAGAVLTKAEEAAGITSYDEDGNETLLSKDLLVKEQLVYTSLGFGREDEKGRMWEIFFRPEWDTSKWSPKEFYPYAGAEGKMPIGRNLAVGARAMYAGEGSLKAKGFIEMGLPKDMKFKAEAGINDKYEAKSLTLGLDIPVPYQEDVSAQVQYGINWFKGGDADGVGLKFGPLLRITDDKEREEEIKGIIINPDDHPFKYFEGLFPKPMPSGELPTTNIPAELKLGRVTTFDGKVILWGPKSKELTATYLSKKGLVIFLDSMLPVELTEEAIVSSHIAEALVDKDFGSFRISQDNDAYNLVLKIEGKEYIKPVAKNTLLLLPAEVKQLYNLDVEYPAIVKLGLEELGTTLAFVEGKLYFDGQQLNTQGKGQRVVGMLTQVEQSRRIPLTTKEELMQLRTHQIYDTARKQYLWHKKDYQSGTEEQKWFDCSAYDHNSQEAENLLLNGYKAMMSTGAELNASGEAIMAEIYRDNLLLVKPDGNAEWIPDAKLADSNERDILAQEIYKGASLMRLDSTIGDTLGNAIQYYYPQKEISLSRVLIIKEPSEVYGLREDGSGANDEFICYSRELGVKNAEDGQGNLVKRFILAEHLDKEGKLAFPGYIGYDAWGKVIVESSIDKNGNIKNVRLHLGEEAKVLGKEILNKLGLEGNEPIERLYNGFDKELNLINQAGWTLDLGAHSLILPDSSSIEFDLIEQIDLDGRIGRMFGIKENKEEMRIGFGGETFEVTREDGADTYLVTKKDDRIYMVGVKVSASVSREFKNLPVALHNNLEAVRDLIYGEFIEAE
ncbi:MAG: putative PEP-binding protein [Candidatus Omnitrophota bacterium]